MLFVTPQALLRLPPSSLAYFWKAAVSCSAIVARTAVPRLTSARGGKAPSRRVRRAAAAEIEEARATLTEIERERDAARAEGIDASGPWPADTLFFRAVRGDFGVWFRAPRVVPFSQKSCATRWKSLGF